MSLQLGLEKSKEALKLSLAKAGITNPPPAELVFDLDVSGSFDDEHRDGLTQQLLQRLVPWGMVFDPDQKLDVFTFSDGERNAHYVGEILPATCEGYIESTIIGRVPGYNGGTDYSYVLEKNLSHLGWLKTGAEKVSPKAGLFNRLFAKDAPTTASPEQTKKRSIVIFVTDGDNSDKERTEKILRESEARRDQVYFLFIAISNQGGNFPFLQKIADMFSNTGVVVIRNLNEFVKKSDEEVNSLLIGEELISWLKK